MYPGNQVGLLSKGLQFIKNINFAGILDGTSKTLNVVNQAIPVIYQAKPLFQNVGTLFKISNAIQKEPVVENHSVEEKKDSSISPIFYL